MFTCAECGEEYGGSAYFKNGCEPICSKCHTTKECISEDDAIYCTKCGAYLHDNETYWVDGNRICRLCWALELATKDNHNKHFSKYCNGRLEGARLDADKPPERPPPGDLHLDDQNYCGTVPDPERCGKLMPYLSYTTMKGTVKKTVNIDKIVQWWIACFGIMGVMCLSQDTWVHRWGFIFGLVAQPAWFITTFRNKQWGIFCLCCIYTVSWCMGIYNFWIKG